MYDERISSANQEETRFVIKRSGKMVPYEPVKIRDAIRKANESEQRVSRRMTDEQIDGIVKAITADVYHNSRSLSVEEIQDLVLDGIFETGRKQIYDLYRDYRNNHQSRRNLDGLDQKIAGIIEVTRNEATGEVSIENEDVKSENSNKNPTILSVQRDYMAGEWSRHYTRDVLLPEDISRAHDEGVIHFHDTDYFGQHMHNCALINLEDMLQNGTNISGHHIDPPKSFHTACTVASQIVAQVASSQYGGQTISLAHLAPFVDVSRQKIRRRLRAEFAEHGIQVTDEQIDAVAEDELYKEVTSGCQTIQYQLVTLQSTNGQAPFVTVWMYIHEVPEGQIREDLALLIKVMLEQRILGIKDRSGNYITPAFPKLIYCLQEDNVYSGTRYWDLTQLAAKCTAKRMVPDYISEKQMLELKGDVYPCMGCRSFLTPDRFTDAGVGNIANAMNYTPGKHRYYGRFNQGVVTLNLPDVALSANGDEEQFWKILDDRMELCHRALRIRHERLLGTPSDVAPILWQDGALARLEPGEVIDRLLYDGYSTLSLGYAGLAETVWAMKGCSHTTEEGKKFGLAVMQAMNDACNRWKKAENIDYSVYGTPLESTTYKFAKALRRRFGVVEHVSDKDYITNSYHVHVTEEIDPFEKLAKEAEFQKLSPGGAISYIEAPNMQDNIEAILSVLQFMYETILYAEINIKSDICEVCGYDGEIQIVEVGGKLLWECPRCGNRNPQKMHVARRTCGYIGTQGFNHGRTAEIRDRFVHLGGITYQK